VAVDILQQVRFAVDQAHPRTRETLSGDSEICRLNRTLSVSVRVSPFRRHQRHALRHQHTCKDCKTIRRQTPALHQELTVFVGVRLLCSFDDVIAQLKALPSSIFSKDRFCHICPMKVIFAVKPTISYQDTQINGCY